MWAVETEATMADSIPKNDGQGADVKVDSGAPQQVAATGQGDNVEHKPVEWEDELVGGDADNR